MDSGNITYYDTANNEAFTQSQDYEIGLNIIPIDTLSLGFEWNFFLSEGQCKLSKEQRKRLGVNIDKDYRNFDYQYLNFSSVPKTVYGNNVYPSRDIDIVYFGFALYRFLSRIGVKIPYGEILKSKITRIDLFVNIELDQPYCEYVEFFTAHSLNFDTEKQLAKRCNDNSGSHTLYFDQPQRDGRRIETKIYNKKKQLQDRGDSCPETTGGVVRIETKFIGNKNIKRILGISQFSDLYQHRERLEQCYRSYIGQFFHSTQLPETKFSQSELREFSERLVSAQDRDSIDINDFSNDCFFVLNILSGKSEKGIRKMLKDGGASDSLVTYWMKKFRDPGFLQRIREAGIPEKLSRFERQRAEIFEKIKSAPSFPIDRSNLTRLRCETEKRRNRVC